MIEITNETQRLVVRKIYPKEDELSFDKDIDGRIIVGRIYIVNDNLIVKNDKGEVEGIFSLNHYYFLK
jgi:hypothetical protein